MKANSRQCSSITQLCDVARYVNGGDSKGSRGVRSQNLKRLLMFDELFSSILVVVADWNCEVVFFSRSSYPSTVSMAFVLEIVHFLFGSEGRYSS